MTKRGNSNINEHVHGATYVRGLCSLNINYKRVIYNNKLCVVNIGINDKHNKSQLTSKQYVTYVY